MLETLRNVWRVPELRKKVLYTFFMLLIYRLVSVIPVPGVDAAAFQSVMANYDILDLMNMMTGSALSQMTLMAMGISPYINASIIMQLLTIAIPALERLQKEGGEEGKKKITRITRYVTVGLAILQAIGIIRGLGGSAALRAGYDSFLGYLSIGIIMAGGTALAMWIGERITKNGVGNGISLIIFTGIVSSLFNYLVSTFLGIFQGAANAIVNFLISLIAIVVILVVVTIVDMSERRIAVQYAKRVVGRKMYGGQSTHIPMKLLSVGVLPLIFAYSFMAFPGTIIAMFGTNTGAYQWWNTYMAQNSFWYILVTTLLIIAFTYFYASISFNPQDIAKNIQQQGGHIPGIRTGSKTVDYLARTSKRLCLFAALFLAVMNIIASLLSTAFAIPMGASSVLIAVSVAIETVRQIESQLVMRNYKGFLG
ncbi:MAG: preprotein translocase subunit SecY [Clostridia bacterium]|nr:preprotein translocase subunit SecY [Clostridia bacterium]